MAITVKTNRIDIRLSDTDKAVLEKAAQYNRQSLSSYIISVVMKQAQMDLMENEMITLSNEEWDRFVYLLENPPKANKALRDLMHEDYSNK